MQKYVEMDSIFISMQQNVTMVIRSVEMAVIAPALLRRDMFALEEVQPQQINA